MKHSRFRHVFAKSIRRSEWFDMGPGLGLAVAANPKMIALAVDAAAGGIVQVTKLIPTARGMMQIAKIRDHEGTVTDLKWDPFNDNVLATASHDSTVRVWHIDDHMRIRCLRVLRYHTRRVCFVEWHTNVDNTVFSASLDSRIIMWNIEIDEIIYVIEDCSAFSLSLNYIGSEFGVTTRSREIVVFNARNGAKLRQENLAHDGSMPTRILYCGDPDKQFLVVTGNSRSARRQIAYYDAQTLTLLSLINIDDGSGLLMPIIDNDLNLLYVAGKGDANIRLFELANESPFISYLNESSGNKAHTAICSLPKRGLDVIKCEIMRILCVDATQLVIEPLSFIVPRRSSSFQSDLFPQTRSPTPSLTFKEWLAGLDNEPILFELKDCLLNCTNKPVCFNKLGNKTNGIKLITSDINNDRKFRFLSKVTKVDYRKIDEREDRHELEKLEEIRAKISSLSESNEDLVENNSTETDTPRTNETVDTSVDFLTLPLINTDKQDSCLGENSKSLIAKFDDSPNVISEQETFSDAKVEKVSMNGIREDFDKSEGKENEKIKKERSTVVENESLINLIHEMERELRKCRKQCENLEKLVQNQQEDMDSLRYEINWKDSRIEYLQAQLMEFDSQFSARST